VNTHDLDEDEWIEFRKKGIGGSDAAAIVGFDPFKSPMTVYLEKTGKIKNVKDNEQMRIGRDLEDYVAKRFEEDTGCKARRKNAILKHPEYDWMLANVDRLLVGKNEGLECKVTGSYTRSEWEKDIPVQYEIQCHHYMAVTGYEAWWIAALIGNEKFVYKKIDRDEEVINYLISLEKSFWESHILSRQMPAPDGSHDSNKLIESMYPKGKRGKILNINKDEFKNKLKRRDEIIELMKKLEKEKNQIDQEIQLVMKEAERAYISNRVVNWSTVHRTRFNYKDFKKDYPDLYKQYINKISYRRFQVR
jgi:putative phage-type endonuclease